MVVSHKQLPFVAPSGATKPSNSTGYIMLPTFAIRSACAALLLAAANIASAQELCSTVSGAVLIAQDDKNTFLGKLTNSFDSQSIFNEFGTYGSEFNSASIWNQFGTFGSEFNSYSPFNSFTSTPPMIIKNRKIIGYLSANKSIQASVSPNLLKAMCKDSL